MIKFSHAATKIVPKIGFCRWLIVNDKDKQPKYQRYYTGNTELGSMWTKDINQAMVYAHAVLATADVNSLQNGKLPEGRHGVLGEDPSWDMPPNDEWIRTGEGVA